MLLSRRDFLGRSQLRLPISAHSVRSNYEISPQSQRRVRTLPPTMFLGADDLEGADLM